MPIELKGKISDIIFQNDENGYTIANLISDELGEVTVVGCMPSVRELDNIQVSGEWKTHDIYGRQLSVMSFTHMAIDSLDGIIAYLASGTIEGIGLKMAHKITDKFGIKAIEILETNPNRYLEIEGIGRKKLDKMISSHMEGRQLKSIITAFSPYGISPAYCMKIYKKYADKSIDMVMNNPYGLCKDVKGIGFKKADEIAKKLNAGLDSLERIEEGIKYLLQEAAYSGHTYMLMPQLVSKTKELLSIDEEEILSCVSQMAINGGITIEEVDTEQRVYLDSYNLAETRAASNLIKLAYMNELGNQEKTIEQLELEEDIELSELQKKAVTMALENKMMVLTGGPGTGKTTTLSFIIKSFEQMKKKIILCAPTGRAAKRMSQATLRPASTIHRLLEAVYSEEADGLIFQKDEDNPIAAHVIIVDEVSMMDVMLLDSLLLAVSEDTAVIFVGDKDQLPSVGAGRVLQDMLESHTIPSIELTEVFRQAKQSMIIVNAHKINKGELPITDQKNTDFFFMAKKTPSQIAELIVELVSDRLPKYYKLSSNNIQVLSPMRKSEAGVLNLNLLLQEALNPARQGKREHKAGNRTFRTGDRVMHIKNNYEKTWENLDENISGEGIFNGDMGYIDFIEPSEKKLYIQFDDGKRAEYDFTELDQIEHAFATTVHKSQGSEFDCVVMPISAFPPMLMSRKILYTALTRAKKLAILVGDSKYLKAMISNVYEEKRNTALSDKLKIYKETGMLLEENNGATVPF